MLKNEYRLLTFSNIYLRFTNSFNINNFIGFPIVERFTTLSWIFLSQLLLYNLVTKTIKLKSNQFKKFCTVIYEVPDLLHEIDENLIFGLFLSLRNHLSYYMWCEFLVWLDVSYWHELRTILERLSSKEIFTDYLLIISVPFLLV